MWLFFLTRNAVATARSWPYVFMLIHFFSAAVRPSSPVEHGFGLEHSRASVFERDLTVTMIDTHFCSAFEIMSYNISLFSYSIQLHMLDSML